MPAMFGLGAWEIGIILVLALLVLGPQKLPELTAQLGKGMRDIRRAANEFTREVNLEGHLADIERTVRERTQREMEAEADSALSEAREAEPDPGPYAKIAAEEEAADGQAEHEPDAVEPAADAIGARNAQPAEDVAGGDSSVPAGDASASGGRAADPAAAPGADEVLETQDTRRPSHAAPSGPPVGSVARAPAVAAGGQVPPARDG